LRGIDGNGDALRLEPEYVKNGLRSVAQHFATVQSGHRTEQDAALAMRRQVTQQRFTPLDRMILARGEVDDPGGECIPVVADPTRSGLGRFAATREQSVATRLMTLETMGLARAQAPHRWEVRRDLEAALKSMQRAADHQKTLAAHGALLSDRRLQLSAPNWRDITSLEGRVLSHGEEENGKRYLLLEGTDARVYYLRNTPELDDARSRGELTTNAFLVIRKTIEADRRRRLTVVNLGDAESILKNDNHFTVLAKRLVQGGTFLPDHEQWCGWLGRYHERVAEAVRSVEKRELRKAKPPELER
jgi:hypothetical protein